MKRIFSLVTCVIVLAAIAVVTGCDSPVQRSSRVWVEIDDVKTRVARLESKAMTEASVSKPAEDEIASSSGLNVASFVTPEPSPPKPTIQTESVSKTIDEVKQRITRLETQAMTDKKAPPPVAAKVSPTSSNAVCTDPNNCPLPPPSGIAVNSPPKLRYVSQPTTYRTFGSYGGGSTGSSSRASYGTNTRRGGLFGRRYRTSYSSGRVCVDPSTGQQYICN